MCQALGLVLSLAPVGGGPQARGEQGPGVMLPMWVLQHLLAKHSESDHFSALWWLPCGSLLHAPVTATSAISLLPWPPPTLLPQCIVCSPPSNIMCLQKFLHPNPPVVPISGSSQLPSTTWLPVTSVLNSPPATSQAPPATKPLCHPSSMQGTVPPSGLPSSPDISMAGRSPMSFTVAAHGEQGSDRFTP